MRVVPVLVVTLLCLLTAACGWHLRGTQGPQATVEQIYLQASEAHGELVSEMRNLLRGAGVELVANANQAPFSLYITDESFERRVAGVGADTLASAYELTLEAEFDIRSRTGDTLVHGASASIIRSYDYSVGDGSTHQQERLLVREMRRELGQQILRRFYAIAGRDPDAAPDTDLLEDAHGEASP